MAEVIVLGTCVVAGMVIVSVIEKKQRKKFDDYQTELLNAIKGIERNLAALNESYISE